MSRSIYVTSVEPFSGKTALALTLGHRLQAAGLKVGYLKPLSVQPWRVGEMVVDEDAAFVKETLGLSVEPQDLSPVVITSELLRSMLSGTTAQDWTEQIRLSYEKAAVGQDCVILEGAASLREGRFAGLPITRVPELLESQVLLVAQYHDEVRLMDDVLSAQAELGSRLVGVVLNRVPTEAKAFVASLAAPYLEKRGVAVFGILPEMRSLEALTVGDLANQLHAEILTRYFRSQSVVENLTVGAMTAETALQRFRQYPHQAVITGGDRTDIQLAALEASTTALILTGNLRPSPFVVKQAEEFGVSVLLVRLNTMEAIQKIESIYGKTRLGLPAKLKQFEDLAATRVDWPRLFQAMGVG